MSIHPVEFRNRFDTASRISHLYTLICSHFHGAVQGNLCQGNESNALMTLCNLVTPAKAGVYQLEIPAFAGMTDINAFHT